MIEVWYNEAARFEFRLKKERILGGIDALDFVIESLNDVADGELFLVK